MNDSNLSEVQPAAPNVSVPRPPFLSLQFMIDAQRNGDYQTVDASGVTGTLMLTYDAATRTGGIFRVAYGRWELYGPVTPGELLQHAFAGCSDVHLGSAASAKLNMWLERISTPRAVEQAPAEGEAA